MTSYTERLLKLPRFALEGKRAIKPGFDRIEVLLEVMGHPEKTFDAALVAGTNGKGSTASMMAACLTSAGFKTGLHTSPHLLKATERMRVDGVPPSDAWLEAAAGRYFSAFESVGASFFEATVVLSLLWFAEQNVSHAVVEVGLGGRMDATNVLSASVSVITSVAFDHTDILGDSIEAIAREKAGIIKIKRPVILGQMPQDAETAIREIASLRESPVLLARDHVVVQSNPDGTIQLATSNMVHDKVALSLTGVHQRGNAATALCALNAWVGPLDTVHIQRALANVGALSGLKGRAEVISRAPFLMLDVAHNPEAVSMALKAFSQEREHRQPPQIVLGLLSDKDVDTIAGLLATSDIPVFTVPTEGVRGLTAEALAHRLKTAGVAAVQPFLSVSLALQTARDNGLSCLTLGSHLVVAEALLWHSEY